MIAWERDNRFLVHLRDERKQNLLFLLNMRIQFGMNLFDQLMDFCGFGCTAATLGRNRCSHLSQLRKFLTYAMVMHPNDVLNETPEGNRLRVRSCGAA